MNLAELLQTTDALAHPRRAQILDALTVATLTVSEIQRVTGFDQPVVSLQLAILRKLGVVSVEAIGSRRYYSISSPKIAQVLNLFRI